jgi:hypothetical protein
VHRVPPPDRARLNRLAGQRTERNTHRRHYAAYMRRLGLHYSDIHGGSVSSNGSFVVVAPRRMSLNTVREIEAVTDFLHRLRTAASRFNRRIVVNLRDCEEIRPEVVPLLAAEYARIRFFRGNDSITGIVPRADVPRAVLHGMGFFENLKIRDAGLSEQPVPKFHIESGISLDGSISKKIADEFSKGLDLDAAMTEQVRRALNEALENSTDHAYFDTSKLLWPAEKGRWWICSIVSPDQKRAALTVCDLGMTIPQTVPGTAAKGGSKNMEILSSLLRAPGGQTHDERMLAAAFDEDVTRRPDGRGGRGLGKMARLLQDFDRGTLTVWSGKAVALVGQKGQPIRTDPLSTALPGTYVLWYVQRSAPHDAA